MRAEQRGSLSNLNYMNISIVICMITHMNISMGDMGDTNTNSRGDYVPLRTTSFLSCALFICSTQQIFDEQMKEEANVARRENEHLNMNYTQAALNKHCRLRAYLF